LPLLRNHWLSLTGSWAGLHTPALPAFHLHMIFAMQLSQLREAIRLKNNIWNFRLSQHLKNQISTLESNRLPSGKINNTGNAHTWNET